MQVMLHIFLFNSIDDILDTFLEIIFLGKCFYKFLKRKLFFFLFAHDYNNTKDKRKISHSSILINLSTIHIQYYHLLSTLLLYYISLLMVSSIFLFYNNFYSNSLFYCLMCLYIMSKLSLYQDKSTM